MQKRPGDTSMKLGGPAGAVRAPAPLTTETPLPAPEPTRDDLGPLVGRTFGGYEIVSFIGDGPSGAVYRGEDFLGNAMAVKVLHAGLANRERTEVLRTELVRLSALNDALLQTIYDTGYGEEGQFFYVTDELIGCDLDTGLADSGGLVPQKSYEIVRAVCQALERAHKAGVVHGGLRPRNVFLIPSDGGRGTAVKVLDFGAARLGGGSDRGILAGLPAYLAPEQIAQGTATPKSDLYALGVLMHELFCGAPPMFGGGAHAALDGRRGPVTLPAGLDAGLSRILLALLESDPARRPPSAAAVLTTLERWAASSAALLDPAGPAVAHRPAPPKLTDAAGPDATARLSKLDAFALAQGTFQAKDVAAAGSPRIEPEPASDQEATRVTPQDRLKPQDPNEVVDRMHTHAIDEKRRTMAQNPYNPPSPTPSPNRDPNSSESVEASLEDFISQANASFPAADGWDLHTGDVELVDDEPAIEPLHSGQMATVSPTAPPVARASASMPVAAPVASYGEPAPPRYAERTEVVSQPLPQPIYHPTGTLPAVGAGQVTWTQNPLIVGSIVLGAVVVGASVMLLAMRTMMPSQPTQVIVAPPPAATAPAPVVAAPAPAAIPAAAAPVVTQLPPAPTITVPAAAAAPVVTPLPQLAPPVAPTAPVRRAAPHRAAPKAAPRHVAPAPKPAAKKEAPAKQDAPKKGGGDWVDPFAN